MLEALSYLLPIILEDLKLHRIEAFVQPDNASSVQLLTRLGFREEGYLANGLEGTEAKPKGILLLPVAVYSGNAQHIFSLPLLAENQMAVAIVAMEQKSIARQRPILHGQATNILQLQADAL